MGRKVVGENAMPFRLERAFGSAPWLKPIEKHRFRVKVFKSGNSLAVRLPAELGLQAGLEMNLETEGAGVFVLETLDRPKRKFNAAKVCGSATNLEPIKEDDRLFEERPLIWPARDGRDSA